MKRLFAFLLAMMLVFTLAACGEKDDGESKTGGGKADAGDLAQDAMNDAEEFEAYSEAAVEHYLKAYGIAYEDLKPDWEYSVGNKSAYGDDPAGGSGHAAVIFKSPDSELTDEQIQAYFEQVFRATAAASDDGYNIIGHEFVGEGEDPGAETTLEDALSGFLQGWVFRKDGKSMAVYVSSTYDNDKESQLDRIFYYNGVKFDIGVGLQKSFDETLEDMEEALEEHEDEIKEALGN